MSWYKKAKEKVAQRNANYPITELQKEIIDYLYNFDQGISISHLGESFDKSLRYLFQSLYSLREKGLITIQAPSERPDLAPDISFIRLTEEGKFL